MFELLTIIALMAGREGAINNCMDRSFENYNAPVCVSSRSKHDGVIGNEISYREAKRLAQK